MLMTAGAREQALAWTGLVLALSFVGALTLWF